MKVGKQTARKILASALALSMIGSVVSFAPATVMAADPASQVENEDNYCYDFEYEENEDGTITLTSFTGNLYDLNYTVNVPPEIDGKTVTAIENIFYNNTSVVSVSLPDTITELPSFSYCTKLKSIKIPSGVKKIWNRNFLQCYALEEINIPEGVESIGSSAFAQCSALKSIVIPGSVKYINSYAFMNCRALESVTLNEGLETISGGTFYGCDSYTEITIPESVTKIGSSAFSDNTENLTIYGSKKSYAYTYATENDIKFVNTKIVVPESIELDKTALTIAKGETAEVKATILPEDADVDEIFWKTGNKAVATVENGVITAVGKGSCTIAAVTSNGLKATLRVTVTDDLKNKSSVNAETDNYGFYQSDLGKDIKITGAADGGSGSYTYAYYYKRITSDKWNTIGTEFGTRQSASFKPTSAGSFDVKVVVRDSDGEEAEKSFTVKAIGDFTWRNNVGEIEITGYKGTGTSIVIPEQIDGMPVRTIARWAFENVPDVESITIPDSFYRIYGNNFYNSKWYQNQSDGPVYLGNILHSYKGTAPSSYTVKEGTVSISQSAFSGKTELKSVTLPESLLHIDNYAFSGSGLTSVTLPSKVFEMGFQVFGGCTSLKSADLSACNITMKNSVETFSGCTALETVKLPQKVTEIGSFDFNDCKSLKSIEIPSTVTRIDSSAFNGCESLTSVIIPMGVTNRIDTSAFMNCPNLEEVIVLGSGTLMSKSLGYMSDGSKVEDLVIYGLAGNNNAKTYANENGFEYVEYSPVTSATDSENDQILAKDLMYMLKNYNSNNSYYSDSYQTLGLNDDLKKIYDAVNSGKEITVGLNVKKITPTQEQLDLHNYRANNNSSSHREDNFKTLAYYDISAEVSADGEKLLDLSAVDGYYGYNGLGYPTVNFDLPASVPEKDAHYDRNFELIGVYPNEKDSDEYWGSTYANTTDVQNNSVPYDLKTSNSGRYFCFRPEIYEFGYYDTGNMTLDIGSERFKFNFLSEDEEIPLSFFTDKVPQGELPWNTFIGWTKNYYNPINYQSTIKSFDDCEIKHESHYKGLTDMGAGYDEYGWAGPMVTSVKKSDFNVQTYWNGEQGSLNLYAAYNQDIPDDKYYVVCEIESGHNIIEGPQSYLVASFDKKGFTEAELPAIEKDGYYFNGWYTRFLDESGDIVKCTKVTKDDFKDSNVLYVRGDYWKYGGSWWAYAFRGNGGTLGGKEEVTFTSPAINYMSGHEKGYPMYMFTPVREGYTFKEWNTKKDGSGETVMGPEWDSSMYDKNLYFRALGNDETLEYDNRAVVLYAQWEKAAVLPEKVTLSKTALTLSVNGSSTLTATVTPANAADKTVKWSTSDSKIATVSAAGKVKAIAAGTAVITAETSNGKKATCKVTVSAPLNNTSVINSDIVQIGDKVRISASANGGAGSYKYAYYYKRSENNTWKVLGTEFGTNTSVAFAPTAEADYDIKVIVKDAKNTTVEKTFTVKAVKELELTNVSVVGREKINLGTAIPMIGKAVGGAGGYTYSFYFKRSTNTNWKLLGDKFTTTASARFKPTATGTYDIRIDVKDSSGTIVKKLFTATVK